MTESRYPVSVVVARIVGLESQVAELPAVAWPGLYPIVYFDADGDVYCSACANRDDVRPFLVDAGIQWEGEAEYCHACGAAVESVYGVPESENSTVGGGV